MNRYEQLLRRAALAEVQYERILIDANVPNTQHARIMFAICLSIAELYGAVLLVLNSKYQNHAVGLIRSMHEALVDLKNLLKDERYLDQMTYDNAEQMIRLFKEFESDPELSKDLDSMNTLAQWKDIEKPKYERLKGLGYKHQTIKDAFKNAGMSQEYPGYMFLCSGTHGNINELVARHYRQANPALHAELPTETAVSFIAMALGNYSKAIIDIYKFSDIPKDVVLDLVNMVTEEWEVLRENLN